MNKHHSFLVFVATLLITAQALAAEKIVFARDGNLVVMGLDGSRQTVVTNDGARSTHPSGSPDGRFIVFVRDDGPRLGDKEIFRIDANGGNLRNLTNFPAWHSRPAWSPNSKRITFASNLDLPPSGPASVYVIDLNGDNLQRLTDDAMGTGVKNPTWSSDGSEIAFLRGARDGSTTDLYIIPSAGGKERRLTEDQHITGIAWSPDGRWIAYEVRPFNPNGDHPLFVIDMNSNRHRLVTNEINYIGGLTWSSDSRRIVFSGDARGGRTDIYSVDLDGSNLTNLTQSPTFDTFPSWFGHRPLSVSPRDKRAASWGWLKTLVSPDGTR